MSTLVRRHFWPCIRILCEWINNRKTTITYGELAERLDLKLAKQEWNGLLDLIAGKSKRELGNEYDITWIVVYGHGQARGLGRYFSQADAAPGSTFLDPKDANQITEYRRKLEVIFQFTYGLKTVEGMTKMVKVPRPAHT